MSRIGHIIGLIFALVLLVASRAFLMQHPLAAAGFLTLASLFYVVCAIVSGRTLFLYPVMFSGATAYYLFIFSRGISYVWYPAHSVLLVSILAIAKYFALKKGKEDYNRAFNNGINITVALFTIFALSVAKEYMLAFFGYAVFYYAQNLLLGERKSFIYAWAYYLVAAALAIPIAREIVYPVLLLGFSYMAIRMYKDKGYFYAIPFLSVMPVISVFSFISAVGSWNILSAVFLINTSVFWVLYKTLRENIISNRASSALEKFFMLLYKAAFLVLPVVFWSLLLRRGFPFSLINVVTTLLYALFFAYLCSRPYKSLVKNRNHNIFLAIGFLSALVYTIGSSYLALASAGLIVLIAVLARKLGDIGNDSGSRSLLDMMLLPIAAGVTLIFSSGGFDPAAGLSLSGITIAALLASLVYTRNYRISYSLSLALWLGVYSLLSRFNAGGLVFLNTYLIGAALATLLGCIIVYRHKGLAGVFGFSSLLFSLTALYFCGANADLKLLTFTSMSVMNLSLGVIVLYSVIGHITAILALGTVLFNHLFDQAIYVTLVLAAVYLFHFLLRRKEKYSYPAGVLFAIGYLLLLIKICPASWVMASYLPLVTVFLIFSSFLPGRVSAYFSSAIIALWTLTSPTVNPMVIVFSSLLYTGSFIKLGKDSIGFRALALSSALMAFYFLMRVFLPVDQALVFFSLLALLFFIAGVILRKGTDQSWHQALISSGIILLLIATALSVIMGFILATKAIIVIASLAYLIAALKFKKEIFLYLLTLNISVLFFNFLQTTGTVFTRDLFVYFLYGVILLSVLFIFPYIRKARRNERVFMMFTIANWKGILIYAIPTCAIIFIVASLYAVKITEHPQFCGACHYMDDYIESWEHSSHKDVKCVECHYEPGVKAIALGKIDGLLQMAKYMTHTYSSRPAAEISDKSCLREGCHDKMNKEAPVMLSRDIAFRHSKHIGHKVKLHNLNCATCHSQATENEHLSVSRSTCFICHFNKKKIEYTDCRLCHNQPDETAAIHKDMFEMGKDDDCLGCHEDVFQDAPRSIRENCFSCHTKRDARRQVPIEELHQNHVTKHNVECFQCHVDILHGAQ